MLGLIPLVAGSLGCDRAGEGSETMVQRDIASVLEAHAAELMAIDGVTGVYEGAREDGTPCLKVMVRRRTAAVVEAVPGRIEGHPVVIVESGEIRPLDGTR